jgi:hypothetical protein
MFIIILKLLNIQNLQDCIIEQINIIDYIHKTINSRHMR